MALLPHLWSPLLLLSQLGLSASAQDLSPELIDRFLESSKMGYRCPMTDDARKKADLCNHPSILTCTPGDLSDGTGTSWKGSKADREKRDQAEFEKIAKPYFARQIKLDPRFRMHLNLKLRETDPSAKPTEEKLVELASQIGIKEARREIPGAFALMSPAGMSLGLNVLLSSITEPSPLYFRPFLAHLKSKLKKPEVEARAKKQFEVVQNEMIKFIKRSIPVGKDQTDMIHRIRTITFAGTECDEMVSPLSGGSKIDSLLIPNAFYDDDKHSFKFCNGLGRTNSSLFQGYAVIAHEIAHSIDPCRFEDAQKPFPAPKIVECLRGTNSVHATFREKPTAASKSSCKTGDQIGEAFADFAAAEVLGHLGPILPKLSHQNFQNGVANVLRMPRECTPKDKDDPFEVHPDTRDRIDRILAAQPDLQRLSGCRGKVSKSLKYCGGSK
jgi:hypothetical protein